MNKIIIVIVAYNRVDSLKRLLNSLSIADYTDRQVDLCISIDKSEKQEILLNLADNFLWVNGEKKIRTFSERQGLKKHVLQCGDLVKDYDGLIMLEDDLVVSKGFYKYAISSLSYYKNNENIAGISLYTHPLNVMSNQVFLPYKINSDVFFMQVAQSWGQCWTKEMWESFKYWLLNNEMNDTLIKKMPQKVLNWTETSWLKKFMEYIVDTNKYFVYPYDSYTSNHTEIGQHNKKTSTDYQVSMQNESKNHFEFVKFEEGIKYDIFFEREDLKFNLNIPDEDVCVDLYCSKPCNFGKRYILTRRKLDFKCIKKYSLVMKPIELNVINNAVGEDIFLYDLGNSKNIQLKGKRNLSKEALYFNICSWNTSLLSGGGKFWSSLLFKIKNFE